MLHCNKRPFAFTTGKPARLAVLKISMDFPSAKTLSKSCEAARTHEPLRHLLITPLSQMSCLRSTPKQMSCQEVKELVLLSCRKEGSNLEKKGVSIVISGAVCILQIAKKNIIAQYLVTTTQNGRSTVPEISCEIR